MDKLPEPLLFEILSRLNDSADVTRSRLASKTFNSQYPHLKTVNLQCTLNWYTNIRSRRAQTFRAVFLKLLSELMVVERVRIGVEKALRDMEYDFVAEESGDMDFTDVEFVEMWLLPSVCRELKSLSLDNYWNFRSFVLSLISSCCHNLVELELKNVWLSVDNMNPMPILTSLTLELVRIFDEDLNELNKFLPNLQVLNLISVVGLDYSEIHFPNLKSCRLTVSDAMTYLSLVTPNLITFRLECKSPIALFVDAPMLSHFHVDLDSSTAFVVTKFENLKTLCMNSLYIGSLLYKFRLTKSVEKLTIDSRNVAIGADENVKFTLEKMFSYFPNLSCLCVKSSVWSELEACVISEGPEIPDGRKGLQAFRAYSLLPDPSLTFSSVAWVLDQCVGLSEVSLLIHRDIDGNVLTSFISKCLARWPKLKWRWGIWSDGMEDSWLTDGISD